MNYTEKEIEKFNESPFCKKCGKEPEYFGATDIERSEYGCLECNIIFICYHDGTNIDEIKRIIVEEDAL